MAVAAKTVDDGRTVNIMIDGRFDFSVQQAFRNAYRNNKDAGTQFNVDLSATEYMDSSALGMLLLLKEHVSNIKGSIVLVRPSATIRKILEMANFNRQFTIS